MSRFAAVPTAALDDERLEALHIRVLTSLCSYADKDGWCRVGQDLIAKRARTNKARVSQCLGDLSGWGWVQKQRVGKKRVNVYRVILDLDFDASIPVEDECVAETANHLSCPPSKSRLPREQITVAETANPLGTPLSNTVSNTVSAPVAQSDSPKKTKRKASPKSSSRGCRIPENWNPGPEGYAFASQNGFSTQEINNETSEFCDYWRGVAGQKGVKLDWLATWRNHIRRQAKFKADRGSNIRSHRKTAESSNPAFRLRDQLHGLSAGQDDAGGLQGEDAFTIDHEPVAAGWR